MAQLLPHRPGTTGISSFPRRPATGWLMLSLAAFGRAPSLAWVPPAGTGPPGFVPAHGSWRGGDACRRRTGGLSPDRGSTAVRRSPRRGTPGLSSSPLGHPTGIRDRDLRSVVDASLAGDYLVRMSGSPPSPSPGESSFAWSLYSIRDVVAASSTAEGSSDEDAIWTDGTEASEALNHGMSPASTESLSGTESSAEIECLVGPVGSGVLESRVAKHAGNEGDERELITLLRILQAQWVAGQKQPDRLGETRKEPSVLTIEEGDHQLWRFSTDALLSQEGISQIFRKAGLLDGDANGVEWVEMVTGSSRIVGRLPRSLVHKYNLLHRGIGAFVTRDRPIDLSSLSSSSQETFPDLYVHRRAADKRIFPSLYDMWVGGVSLAGEDSHLTAQREIAEELGLSGALSASLAAGNDGSPFLTCLVCTAYNRCLVDLFQYAMDTTSERVKWQKEEVAWGDFVDYGVVMASADLSIQRAASARTWPGSYPPIQSELRGILPEGDGSTIASHNENWDEWDYVPDGLLVWEAWLEFLEKERAGIQRPQQQDQTISFEIDFGENEVVTVELASMEDIVPKSQEIAARFNADIAEIQTMLKQVWADATFVPLYDGPSLPIQSGDDLAECSVELPSGLVVELRPSTIGENAGLGLFVRKASIDIDDVLQTQGSAFCGYGSCGQITDSLDGTTQYQRKRSFEFMLSDGLDSYVWYEGNLLTVRDVIQSTGAAGVKAHILADKQDEEGNGRSQALIHDPEKPCYLVPPAERPDPKLLSIQTMGHMCNDLAGGIQRQTEEEYNIVANRDNLLVLVPRVEVNDNGILQPNGMPILTLCKSVRISNVAESMEVGLRYGHQYWKNEFS